MFDELLSLTRQASEYEKEITPKMPYKVSIQSRKLLSQIIKLSHKIRKDINEIRKQK